MRLTMQGHKHALPPDPAPLPPMHPQTIFYIHKLILKVEICQLFS